MTDIATLGLKIDSRDTVAAKKALDDLTASAKPAAAAAANMEKAGAAAAKGGAAIAKSGALARHELVNLSRQLQDVGTMAAMGANPLTIVTSQFAQIMDIFSSSKTGTVSGAFKQIVGGIGAARLAMLGIAGAAAGAVFAMKGIADGAKDFDDLARSVGAARGELHGLQQVASNKGISNDDFSKSIAKWGDDIYRAKNGMGGLAEVMRANGKSAKDFNGYLENAADLIKNAKDDQTRLQLLQQMGLPATMQWVRFLSQGKDGIRAATEEAVRFNETAEGKMIAAARRFDEAWDTTTTRWVNRFKSGAIEVGGALSGITIPEWMKNFASGAAGGVLGGPMGMIGGGLAGIVKGKPADPGQALITGSAGLKRSDYEWGGPKETVDPAVAAKRISDRQTYLGLLGQTISAEQAAEQVRLQADAAYQSTGVSVGAAKIKQLQDLAREQTIGVSAIKASTDAANIDAATVGMSTGKATEYAAAQNAINAARQAGRELTPTNIAQIQSEAAALGQAAAQADLLRFSYTNLVNGPMQAFRSAIAQGATAWDALKKAGISALDAVSSKLMDMAAQNLWKSAFGGSSGGGFGGLFGSLFGGGGQTMANPYDAMPKFAAGTNSAPGGWSIVGEKGPELMNVPRGAQILPNGVSPASSGGTPVVMQDNRVIHIGQGASQETVAQLKEAFAQDRAARFAETVEIVKRAKSGRHI